MDVLSRLNSALIGRYTVQRELGAGGMATVYLALDTRHDREVAIKVLHPDLGAALGAERFLAEIKTTAKLQHPHILPLLDSGDADGLVFYVMPVMEGETLRSKLERERQLPLDDAIRIATETAGALDYAHRHGVIHRDIKPENILLHDGRALIADFGIALAVSAASGPRMTQTGLSLGTPQYMAPEQAMGERAIDARADIYALGAVLYELLTGEPPFSGATVQAIVAKVLTERPMNPTAVRDTIPPHVAATVMKALAKLPADRFATAHEFSDALNGKIAVGETSTAAHASPPRERTKKSGYRALLPWGIAAAALLAGAWAAGSRATMADETPVAFAIDIRNSAATNSISGVASVAVSRDGETIAYAVGSGTDDKLYVRKLAELTETPIPAGGDVWAPFFSPDGKLVAFFAEKKLLKAPVGGGPPIVINDRATNFGGGSWGRDGEIITSQQAGAHGLLQFSDEGGSGRVLTKGTNDQAEPLFLDDGETMLFMDWGPGFTEDDYIGVASAKTGQFTVTNILAAQPLGVIDGRLIYATVDGRIMAVPFDMRARKATGAPLTILSDALGIPGGAALSPAGTLVYVRGTQNQRLVLIDSAGVHALTSEERLYSAPALSRDGRRVAVAIAAQHGSETTSDIWTFDRPTKTFTQLTSFGNVTNPVWTADGKRLVFATWFDKSPTIWMQQADGSAPPEKILQQPDNQSFRSVVPTPDGRGLVYCARLSTTEQGLTGLFYIPLDGNRKPELILGGETRACEPSISPDGKWLAYDSNESGSPETSVRPFRASGARVQLSQGGGMMPVWSRDGKRVMYWHAGKITAAMLQPSGSSLEVARRMDVLPNAYIAGSFDFSADGRQVLTTVNSDQGVAIVVIKHWLSTLRAKVAASKK